jgi:uncharacterized damage-inducible protein DinB
MVGYEELFDYFKRERVGLLQTFENISIDDFTRDRGLSFGSIKGVFVHTVMVEDIWLHYRIAGLGVHTPFKQEDFVNLEDIVKYINEVDEKTVNFFRTLTKKELNREFKVARPDGRESVEKIENVLYHIPIENIHHYGEIFAELWKMSIQVPYHSYLTYIKERKK